MTSSDDSQGLSTAELDELLNVPYVFWLCPKGDKHRVKWVDEEDKRMTPHCLDCGEVGATR